MPALTSTSAPPTDAVQRVWILRITALLATTALLALSAPLIWAAVSSGLGLLALGAMAIIGTVLFHGIPLAMQRLENRILHLRKSEARTNPIEQLQNDCLRREERLKSFRQALVTIGGQIQSMKQMVAERSHIDPGHVLDRQQQALQRMTHFYDCNLDRLDQAHAALEEFRHQVKQKMFEWEFAKAGQRVMAALNPNELQDLMQDLLTDEALRSVQSRFNTVFAELDVEMRSMDSPAQRFMQHKELEQLDALTLPTVTQKRRFL